jgi:hypothetical protein
VWCLIGQSYKISAARSPSGEVRNRCLLLSFLAMLGEFVDSMSFSGTIGSARQSDIILPRLPKRNDPMIRRRVCAQFALATGLVGLAVFLAAPSTSASPYGSVNIFPSFPGPGIIKPENVNGKEYSHDLDLNAAGALDPQRVIAWDGSGGVADGLYFTGSRPNYTPEDQVDALASSNDVYYSYVRTEEGHLLFSIDDEASARFIGPAPGPPTATIVPSAGLIPLVNGNFIGGAGEISYELGTSFGALPSTQARWATQAQVNDMPLPIDVDGLEVWGPEPGVTGNSDKYSLQDDVFSGVSVWNGSGTSYIPHSAIVTAVTSLLGSITNLPLQQLINLDALMVHDIIDNDDSFDRNGSGGPGDEILFSIRQIVDPVDPSGYYATGSEIFYLNATGGPGSVGFLSHGGHLWDKTYALANLGTLIGGGTVEARRVQHDINAIEAVGDVPEPASFVLVLLGLAAVAGFRTRGK